MWSVEVRVDKLKQQKQQQWTVTQARSMAIELSSDLGFRVEGFRVLGFWVMGFRVQSTCRVKPAVMVERLPLPAVEPMPVVRTT